MGYFDSFDTKNVRPPISRRYNEDGVHVLAILENKLHSKETGLRLGKPEAFVLRTITLQSSAPAQEVGAVTSWSPLMSWDGTPKDLMSLIAAAGRCRFEEVTKAHLNAITEYKKGPDGLLLRDAAGHAISVNALAGQIVKVRVTSKAREGKSDFSQHEWSPVPPNIYDEMKAKAAEWIKKINEGAAA